MNKRLYTETDESMKQNEQIDLTLLAMAAYEAMKKEATYGSENTAQEKTQTAKS